MKSYTAKITHSLTLNPWQLCDLEMILNGGFSPLNNFMSQADYNRVIHEMRLVDGSLWPIPITLDTNEELPAGMITLQDPEGALLATLDVNEVWQPNKKEEAQAVFGTIDEAHPGVNYLLHQKGSHYISGKLTKVCIPKHYDFTQYRLSPEQVKDRLKALSVKRLVGFQTRNPMHRAHYELTLRAAKQHDAKLLIQPVVGMTKPGDIDYFTRARCYQKILDHYPLNTTFLNFLPLAMRMAGPREALWHMLIRKNYGCTHFIIGRDHAGPGVDSHGKPFYDPYAAQDLAKEYQSEAGIEMIPFQEMVYSQPQKKYIPINQAKKDENILRISGTEIRHLLNTGQEIPAWFSFPEIITELRDTYPSKNKQGVVIFLTGLSGAGKSTIAKALITKLMETTKRKITLLDGDIVRKNLSYGLGFSRKDRDANIARIAFVAAEVAKHGGIAICAQIAPYATARNNARKIAEAGGAFIEVHISTPLDICEQRDPKGLYEKVRNGKIKNFTGITDPYELPKQPDIELDTSSMSIENSADKIISYLTKQGYLKEVYKGSPQTEALTDSST